MRFPVDAFRYLRASVLRHPLRLDAPCLGALVPQHVNNTCTRCSDSSVHQYCILPHSCTTSPASMTEPCVTLGAPGLAAGSCPCFGPSSADNASPGADPACTSGYPGCYITGCQHCRGG
ncbi:UNVERIFIED_CONTAM: hypothetical protein FKN15_032643 [Acipenser sinensis]